MRFALIMRATSSPLTPQVTPVWLAGCAAAIEVQLNRDLAAHWGGDYALRVSDGSDLVPGEIAFTIVDTLPAAPGAVAYHDVGGNAVPIAFLALSTCSTLGDVSTGISHECCETAGDPGCNAWVTDNAGLYVAAEVCDAVESANYAVTLSDGRVYVVSDFLLRSFFVPGAPGPYSYTGAASAPFLTATGGYQITFRSDAQPTQVTARTHPVHAARMTHWSSRSYRRARQTPSGGSA